MTVLNAFSVELWLGRGKTLKMRDIGRNFFLLFGGPVIISIIKQPGENMKNNKVRVSFEITLKDKDNEEELYDFLTYIVEVFAIPEDAKRIRELHKESFMSLNMK
ncbi:hypothetical protein KKA14_09390 [bacterium]|nr:hypothetical protein [bacterium]